MGSKDTPGSPSPTSCAAALALTIKSVLADGLKSSFITYRLVGSCINHISDISDQGICNPWESSDEI